MKYFDQFFNDLPFFQSLKSADSEKNKRVSIYLTHPSQSIFQTEINKWLGIAYKHNVANHYKQRLSGNNVNFISLQSVVNELMVAYFVSNYLNMQIKKHNPPAAKNKFGEWIFTKNSREMFVEVKTPWEEHREGTFAYSQFNKLETKLKKAYKQKPTKQIPFVIFITDDLNLSPTIYNHELIDVLYGQRGICFSKFENGCLKNPEYKVVDRRSIFQRNIRRGLSGVASLRFMVWLDETLKKDQGKYHFSLYHNPYCHAECKLTIDWFKPYKQYLSHNKTVE